MHRRLDVSAPGAKTVHDSSEAHTSGSRATSKSVRGEPGSPSKAPPAEAELSPETRALLDRYLRERGAARNLSSYTLRNYGTDLEHFLLALAGWQLDPLKAQRTDLRRYLAVLLGNGVADGSVRRKVSTIRSFYKWLRAENLLENDPFFGVTGPKAGRRLPDILTSEDIDSLIKAAEGDEPAELRDRALLELLYAAGLRVSEVASLDVGELDVRDRSVRVHGKGKKDRVGVFGEPAANALQVYLRDGRPQLVSGKQEALFLNRSGGRLTPRSVQTHGAQICHQGRPADRGTPAPAASQLRDAPARRRRRPARRAGAAGPREPEHDADIHPRLRGQEAQRHGVSVRGAGAHRSRALEARERLASEIDAPCPQRRLREDHVTEEAFADCLAYGRRHLAAKAFSGRTNYGSLVGMTPNYESSQSRRTASSLSLR